MKPLASTLGPKWSSNVARAASGVVALSVIVAGCSSSHTKAVVVAKAIRATVNAEPGGVGQTSAAVDLPLPLGFSATIDSTAVQPGDHVTKGQALLTAHPVSAPIAAPQARSKLLSDQASALAALAAIATQHSKPAALAAARARLVAANARILVDTELLNIAEGRVAALTSPIDGVVASVAAVGATLGRSKPAIEIVDYSSVLVTVKLPIEDQSSVTSGQSADVTYSALGGLTLTGTVLSVAPVAIDSGQSFQLVVKAPNTHDDQVRPGLLAFVKVKAPRQAAIAVPDLCVLNKTTNPTVFVVDGGVARLRHVTIGASDSKLVQIVRGLDVGEQCVIANNQQLSDGTRVRVSSERTS